MGSGVVCDVVCDVVTGVVVCVVVTGVVVNGVVVCDAVTGVITGVVATGVVSNTITGNITGDTSGDRSSTTRAVRNDGGLEGLSTAGGRKRLVENGLHLLVGESDGVLQHSRTHRAVQDASVRPEFHHNCQGPWARGCLSFLQLP